MAETTADCADRASANGEDALAELTSEVESRLKLESAGAMEECVCEAVGDLDGDTVRFECTYKMKEEDDEADAVASAEAKAASKEEEKAAARPTVVGKVKRKKEGVVAVNVP